MNNGFSKSIFFSIISQLFYYATPLILSPFVSRVLGPTLIGEYSYCASYSYYFANIIALGFGTLGIKIISEKKDNKNNYSKYFWSIIETRVAISLFAIPIYIILIVTNSFGGNVNIGIMFVLILSLLANMIDTRFLFQGLGNFKIISILQIIFNLLYLSLVFAFVRSTNDLVIYSLFKTSVDFLINVILLFFCINKVAKPSFDIIICKQLFKKSILIFVPSLLISCGTQLDQTFLGILSDNYQVGIYQQAVKFPILMGNLSYAISPVALSFTSGLDLNTDKELIKSRLTKVLCFSFFVSAPCCIGLISIADIFIPFYFGDEYFDVINLVYILSFMVLFSPLSSLLINGFFYPFDKIREVFYIAIIQIFCNCVLNFIFIYILKLGAIGASVATLICEIYLFFSLTLRARKFINFKNLIMDFLKIICSCLIMFVLAFTFNYYCKYSLTSFFILFIDICIGVFVYSLFLFISKEFNFLLVLKKIKEIIFNNRSNKRH